jgi:anti-sigma factor RsiW
MSQSSRIPDTHAEAWAMLPFLANGRISPEDREWVELHLQDCAECRRELDEQRALAAHMRDAPAPFTGSEQRAFAKLWTRIEAAERAIPARSEDTPAAVSGSARVSSSRTVRWLAAAVIVQAVGLAALGFVALNRGDSVPVTEQVLVTDAPEKFNTAAPSVRLMFAPETSVEAMGAILASHGLELVGGPGDAGVFTAALPAKSDETPEAVANALRADPRVHFAEPVMH